MPRKSGPFACQQCEVLLNGEKSGRCTNRNAQQMARLNKPPAGHFLQGVRGKGSTEGTEGDRSKAGTVHPIAGNGPRASPSPVGGALQ